MRRVTPADDFMIIAESDAAPMTIGALQLYDVPPEAQGDFFSRVREHFAARLPATPLMCRRHEAPERYDADAWFDLATVDLDRHVIDVGGQHSYTRAELLSFVGGAVMKRLAPDEPPFRVQVIPRLAEGGSAVIVQVPHGFVDGIGFQSLLALLTDASPLGAPAAAKPLEESVPSDAAWRAAAERRFAEEAPAREAQAAARREAEAALAKLAEDATRRRTKTPLLGRHGGPTTAARRYETLSMPLERFKSIGQRLDGTVNDVFLAVTGGALRRYLLENNDLPEGPVVVNSARSYRRAEHGDWGNRIVALHPHVATDTANPLERFRGIRESMARELDRSRHDEILVDRLEWPYGPKKRREVLAARVGSGERLLPGNITVSNVPGPSGPRYLAGFRQIANYPAPILGNGRFLNLTLRRNAANLDLGIMCDAGKVSDAGAVRLAMLESLDEIEAASGAAS